MCIKFQHEPARRKKTLGWFNWKRFDQMEAQEHSTYHPKFSSSAAGGNFTTVTFGSRLSPMLKHDKSSHVPAFYLNSVIFTINRNTI